jgi:hypothetical protein
MRLIGSILVMSGQRRQRGLATLLNKFTMSGRPMVRLLLRHKAIP